MADEKVEYLPPPEFQARTPLDYSKIVPAGVGTDPDITAQFERANKATEDYAKALEQRFAQPNWFRIAAGFAKPQLGGFIASLGSASEEMGRQQEASRAIAPSIARMRAEVSAGQLTFAQRMKQKELLDKWRTTGKPMDASTYEAIVSYGADTDVAKAARGYYDAAKAGLDITTAATGAMGKDPLLQLEDFTKFQLKPDTDEKTIKQKQEAFVNALNAAKPPQMDQAQWDAMSRYEKMEASNAYARSQREAGMNAEANFGQLASQAPQRLALLGTIRDLAMGVGVPDVVDKKTGQTITGAQQMAKVLGIFQGNNPFEVIARAAAEGRIVPKLEELDKSAAQYFAENPAVRDQYQKLVKLLAENQVSLRNAAVNPTDASSLMQQLGSPNIGNSQRSLITLVDLLAHGEQNTIDRYKYIVDNRVPYRQLPIDPGYLDTQRRYALEHRQIATQDPYKATPSFYNVPSATRPTMVREAPAPATPAAQPAPAAAASQARPNERIINGKRYIRDGEGKPWRPAE